MLELPYRLLTLYDLYNVATLHIIGTRMAVGQIKSFLTNLFTIMLDL